VVLVRGALLRTSTVGVSALDRLDNASYPWRPVVSAARSDRASRMARAVAGRDVSTTGGQAIPE